MVSCNQLLPIQQFTDEIDSLRTKTLQKVCLSAHRESRWQGKEEKARKKSTKIVFLFFPWHKNWT